MPIRVRHIRTWDEDTPFETPKVLPIRTKSNQASIAPSQSNLLVSSQISTASTKDPISIEKYEQIMAELPSLIVETEETEKVVDETTEKVVENETTNKAIETEETGKMIEMEDNVKATEQEKPEYLSRESAMAEMKPNADDKHPDLEAAKLSEGTDEFGAGVGQIPSLITPTKFKKEDASETEQEASTLAPQPLYEIAALKVELLNRRLAKRQHQLAQSQPESPAIAPARDEEEDNKTVHEFVSNAEVSPDAHDREGENLQEGDGIAEEEYNMVESMLSTVIGLRSANMMLAEQNEWLQTKLHSLAGESGDCRDTLWDECVRLRETVAAKDKQLREAWDSWGSAARSLRKSQIENTMLQERLGEQESELGDQDYELELRKQKIRDLGVGMSRWIVGSEVQSASSILKTRPSSSKSC